MSKIELVKISDAGEQLPADATEWTAVLLPQHGLMFTATHVAANGTQQDCEAKAKACTLAGFTDWELPTVEQLQLLVDRSRHDPAIDTNYFRDIESDWYWTATPAAWSSASAWFVGFYYGGVYSYRRSSNGFALAVRRAGQ